MIHTPLYSSIKVALMAQLDAPAAAGASIAPTSTPDGGLFSRALRRVRAVFA